MGINPHTAARWNLTARADRLVEEVLRRRPKLDAATLAAFNRCDRPGAATEADVDLLEVLLGSAR